MTESRLTPQQIAEAVAVGMMANDRASRGLGLKVTHWFDSPIEGGDGNHEFFIQARKGMDAVDDDLPLPAAPARQAAKRVPRSATRSLLDAMDEDGEAAHAGQPGPARSKRRDKKNAAD